MKKRLLTGLMIITSVLLIACGKTESYDSQNENSGVQAEEAVEIPKQNAEIKTDFETLEEVLAAISADFDTVIKNTSDGYTALKPYVDSYDRYKDNIDKTELFFATIESESDNLFERCNRYSETYFKMALNQYDDKKDLERAFGDYYDAVYEDAYDDYYKSVYDRLYDDYYDEIYGDMFDDAYDTVPFKEYSEAHSDCYSKYSDSHSAVYKKYADNKSYCYLLYSTMKSKAVYGDERDYDSIMAIVQEEMDERAADEKRRQEAVDYETVYEIRDGKAYVTGISGEGNHITINLTYEDCAVVGIDESAFEGTNIQGVTCWADIETIGDRAFKDCKDLVEISIPNSTIVIGNQAFENCSSLKELLIWGHPDIGEKSFANCTTLDEVSISNETQKICDNAFDGCSSLAKVYVWGSDTKIGKNAFANCDKLEKKPTESGESVKLDNIEKTIEEDDESEEESKSEAPKEGIRPEFQTAMDEYIEFFEEYVTFMKKYSESSDVTSMMSDYSKYMTQYIDTMDALDKVSNSEMSKEEEKLYLDTLAKINKMLLDAM